ncbi:MAG: hypothetical protein IPK50_11640 [Fibrobacterota bacterium]|nr:hypothetical protein [Fibrobacterota bacterium]QQS07524.1 MAG: hypothetical protein IPK50_11640 [Fibrobacterota bacterium]
MSPAWRQVLAQLLVVPLWFALHSAIGFSAGILLFAALIYLPMVLLLRIGWRCLSVRNIVAGWLLAAFAWIVLITFLASARIGAWMENDMFSLFVITLVVSLGCQLMPPKPAPQT